VLVTNKNEASAEVFESEVVVIHFVEGTYFSIRGAGLALWNWLELGADEALLEQLLAEKYGLDKVKSRETVAHCVSELKVRGLVVEVEGTPAEREAFALDAGVSEFEEPLVEAFDDLQELIAIDPVHEVDPMQGWPHRPPKVELD
jgi:hypothetical protein